MSSAIIEPKLGRVAKTSKPNTTDANVSESGCKFSAAECKFYH